MTKNILQDLLEKYEEYLREFTTGDAGIGGAATGYDMQGDHIYAPGDARNPGHFGSNRKRRKKRRKESA